MIRLPLACLVVATLAACGETPSPAATASTASALLSCNTTPDCAGLTKGTCVTIACTSHVCTKTDVADCCADVVDNPINGRCNDGNACTTDVCNVVAIGMAGAFSATCQHTQDSLGSEIVGCCTTVSDCPGVNSCQLTRACTDFSCTYTADATLSGCCNADSDCSAGTCNRATNRCVCPSNGLVCPGASPGSEVCNAECCVDNDCDLANAQSECKSGVCTIKSCTSGFDDCNTTDSDGCEVNLNTDEAHCSECNKPCGGATGACEVTDCTGGECSVILNPSPPGGSMCCSTALDCPAAGTCQLVSCVLHQCASAPDPACNDMAVPPDLASTFDLLPLPADLASSVDLTPRDLASTPDPDLRPPAPDLAVVDLAVALDLTTSFDLGAPPDLAVADDLSASPDLLASPDLTVEQDLTGMTFDLLVEPDLLPPSDLATDLPPPDLRMARPDLQGTYSATGGGFGCAAASDLSTDGMRTHAAGWVALALLLFALRRPRRASSPRRE